jgi:(p)ppGpp synthase/HD superfamily hydrolase
MSNSTEQEALKLTDRFDVAVEYARLIHTGTRKGSQVPYMAHLLGVASLVMGETGHVPFAVTEDMVIAALLHDAVEDEGGLPRLANIEEKFGKGVAEIVLGCSDSVATDSDKKEDWATRKAGYIKKLPGESQGTLLVSVADKLYNSRAMLGDYRDIGAEIWKRFKRGRNDQIGYFEALLKVYEVKCEGWRIVGELKRVVTELKAVTSA